MGIEKKKIVRVNRATSKGTRQISPSTNLPLATAQLIPTYALREAMEECMERDMQEGRVDPACLEITQQELGAGSFGRVWAGWPRHGRTRLRVAVKRVDMPGAEQEAVESSAS